jgi:hypothetical protein
MNQNNTDEFEQMKLYGSLERVALSLVSNIPDKGLQSKLNHLLNDYRQCGYSQRDIEKSYSIYSNITHLLENNRAKFGVGAGSIYLKALNSELAKASDHELTAQQLNALAHQANNDFADNMEDLLSQMKEIKSNIAKQRNAEEAIKKDEVAKEKVQEKPAIKAAPTVAAKPANTVNVTNSAKQTLKTDLPNNKAVVEELERKVINNNLNVNELRAALQSINGQINEHALNTAIESLSAQEIANRFNKYDHKLFKKGILKDNDFSRDDFKAFIELGKNILDNVPDFLCQNVNSNNNAEYNIVSATNMINMFNNYEIAYNVYLKNANKIPGEWNVIINSNYPNGHIPSPTELKSLVNAQIINKYNYILTANIVSADGKVIPENLDNYRAYIAKVTTFMNQNEIMTLYNRIMGNLRNNDEHKSDIRNNQIELQTRLIMAKAILALQEKQMGKKLSIPEKANLLANIYKTQFGDELAKQNNPYEILNEHDQEEANKLKNTLNKASGIYTGLDRNESEENEQSNGRGF